MIRIPAVGIALLMLAGCPSDGNDSAAPPPCSTASQDLASEAALVASWSAIKATGLSQIQVAAGFQAPERVPGAANTIGWEDSAFISPDGTSLWFAYLPGDLVAWGIDGGGNPAFPTYQRGPIRGTNPSPQPLFEMFGCSFLAGATCAPVPFPYSHPGGTFSGQLTADGHWFYCTYASARDIGRDGVGLPATVNSAADEDDPHFLASAWGNELFFDSGDRPGGPGSTNIWLTSESAGTWAAPAALPGPINLAGTASQQPHFRSDNVLYFASDRDDNKLAIWSSLRTGASTWAAPQKLVWADGTGTAVGGIGEPTLTADGAWLYFVVVFVDTSAVPTRYDADIGRVRTGP